MHNTIGFFFKEDFGGSNGLGDDLSSDCKTATLAAMFTELNKKSHFQSSVHVQSRNIMYLIWDMDVVNGRGGLLERLTLSWRS